MTMNRTLSGFIDCSRWVAAFCVVFGHAGALLISHERNDSFAMELFSFTTSLGHDAVVVFFVISGFLVGGVTFDRWLSRGAHFSDYVVSRFSRIYIVLIPALTIGFILDVIGMRYFNDAAIYTNPAPLGIGSLVKASTRLDPQTYIGNLLMLQGVSVTSLGSNSPLWSLAYEWWYYCLFFIVLAGFFSKGWLRAAWWACALPLLLKLPGELVLWMTIWLMGVAAFFICTAVRVKTSVVAVLSVLIVGVALTSWGDIESGRLQVSDSLLRSFWHDLWVGVGYSLCLIAFSHGKRCFPWAAFNQWAAGFSYSIYLLHFPVLLLLVAISNDVFGVQPLMPLSFSSLAFLTLIVVLVYVVGYGFSLMTEKHTSSLKKMLQVMVASVTARVGRT